MWKVSTVPAPLPADRDRCPRCARLTAERDELAERVRRLEEVIFDDDWVPSDWGVSPAGKIILTVLALRGRATKEVLLTALEESGRPGRKDGFAALSPKNVDVHVSHLRKRVPSEIEIRTVWGEGFALAPASRLFLTELMKARAA